MNVLLYAVQHNGIGERLKLAIETLNNLESLVDCWSMRELIRLFQTPDPLPEAVVLLVSGKEELQLLLPFRFRLEQVFFILILPDAEEETIACGHQLRPRFIAYQDSDFSEIEAVLKRLVSRSNGYPGRYSSSSL